MSGYNTRSRTRTRNLVEENNYENSAENSNNTNFQNRTNSSSENLVEINHSEANQSVQNLNLDQTHDFGEDDQFSDSNEDYFDETTLLLDNSINPTVSENNSMNNEDNQVPRANDGDIHQVQLPQAQLPQFSILDKDFAFIPDFSGNREQLHKFVSSCDMINSNFSPEDDRMFLNIIRNKITGPAYSVIKYKDFSNWSELKEILLEQYLELRTYEQIQEELVNVKQGVRENVRSYANRVEKLLADLNDACAALEGTEVSSVFISLNNITALKSFVRGLNDPFKLIVKASRYTTLIDAIEAAVEEERSLPTKAPTTMNKSRNNLRCTYCHKIGHTSANCFQRINFSLPKFSPNTRPQIKRENPTLKSVRIIVCSYCKNKGHNINQCRKRTYNNSMRNGQSSNSNHVTNSNTSTTKLNSGNGMRPRNGGVTRAESLINAELKTE